MLFTIISAALLMIVGEGSQVPFTMPNAYGFTDAMMWYELADSADEVFKILGPSDSKQGLLLRTNLDAANQMDFLFMFSYSGFNLFAMLFLTKLRKPGSPMDRRLVILYAGLVACMLLGDIVENMQLFTLSSAPRVESILPDTILYLQIFTRIKWMALFIALLIMGINYTKYYSKSLFGIIALVFYAGFFAGMISIIFQDKKALLELAAALMSIGWLWIGIHGLVRWRSIQIAPESPT